MEEGTSLDDILGNEAEDATEQGQPRDEHGRFAPASQPEAEEPQGEMQEAPPASEPEPDHIPIAALKDERNKRQRIEDEYRQAQERLAQYDAYFQQLNQQTQGGQEEQEVDPVEYIAQQVMSRIQPQAQQQELMMRGYVSEQFARQKWADYDEKAEVFKEAAQQNGFLLQELVRAPDPAGYIYQVANNYLAARQYGTAAPPSESEIEARLREKIMAEIGVSKPQVPTSLAGAQSMGSRSGPAWSGPSSIDDILAR